MASLIQLFMPTFKPPATVESAVSKQVLAPHVAVADAKDDDKKVRDILKRGARSRAAK